ncbi:MAG TPA: GGDEF domain-containing protein [Terriglobales bacterium]|nr:GGDEF domain-containing protein [Terriglobales bacterium]
MPQEVRDEARKQLEDQMRLRHQVQALEERDFQLWSIVVLVALVMVAGVAGLLVPSVVWHIYFLKFNGHYLPQLLFGLIALVLLFNIYVIKQRLELRHTREELVLQMVYNEAAERLSLVDPLTDTFNRRYMDQVIAKDLSRAERQGVNLVFLMIDVNDFKSVNTRFGHITGDRILVEVAQVLKRTFRASDIIIRFGGDEFLVMLADTDEKSSEHAIDRLQKQLQKWNASSPIAGYHMSLSWGAAIYGKGSELKDVLDAADHRMYEHKSTTRKGAEVAPQG